MRRSIALALLLAAALPALAQERKLVVGTKRFVPFVTYGSDGPAPDGGFSFELWNALAADLDVATEWRTYATVKELIDAVERREVDVAIAGISVTMDRERRIDFSLPMFDAGLQLMVPVRHEESLTETLTALMSPSLLKALLGALVVLIALAHLLWWVERRHNDGISERYLRGIADALWWTVVTVTTVGYGDIAPRTTPGRLIAVLWMGVTLFVLTGFIAAVSSALTVHRLERGIAGPGDLPGHRVAAVQGSTSADYLRGVPRVRVLDEYLTVEDLGRALREGRADAAVYDAPVVLYYAAHEGGGAVEVVGPKFKKEHYGIAFPTGSAEREAVNQALLRLRESGAYRELYLKYFGREN